MARTIDLIADVGESFGSWTMGRDAEILAQLTSANVACGFHAGDPLVMERTVGLCRDLDVRIGAHPGFRDLVGFGRREIDSSADEIRTDVLYQIAALDGFVRAAGGKLQHVTPHGRLGNLVVTQERYAVPVLDAIAAYNPELIVVAQEGVVTQLAAERGIPAARLGLADHAFEDDGSLVSRRKSNAVLHDPELIAARAVKMVTDGTALSVNGVEVATPCDTILLHGDNEASIEAARLVRAALEAADIQIRPLASS